MNLFQIATRGIDLDSLPEPAPEQMQIDTTTSVKAPSDFDKVFSDAGDAYGVDPAILKSMALAESAFNPDIISGKVKSRAGAIGLMQFMKGTADEYGIDPTNPVEAIFGAAAYMRKSLDKFGGDYGRAVASYNSGAGLDAYRDEDWDARLPPETQVYLSKVFGAVDQVGLKPTAPQAKTEATQLPAGVTPSKAGAGRGVVNPGMVNTQEVQAVAPPVDTLDAKLAKQGEFSPLEEGGKGLQSGYTGLKQMWEANKVLKDSVLANSMAQRLSAFDRIDAGATDVPRAIGLAYQQADAAGRAKIRADAQKELSNRQDFIGASMETIRQYQAEQQRTKGRTTDLTDVGNLKDFGNWLAFNGASGVVSMAPLMVAAVATGQAAPLVAGVMGYGMATGELAGDRIQNAQGKLSPQRFSRNPDRYDDAVRAENQNVTDYVAKTAGSTVGVAVPFAGLDVALGPVASLLKGAGKEAAWQGVKGATKEIAKDAGEEAVAGGSQEVMKILTENALGEQDGVLTGENLKRVINSAAAEAAGGTVGGAGRVGYQAATRATPTVESQPTTPQAPTVTPQAPVTPDTAKTQAVDNIAAAILEAEGATAKTTPVPPAGEAKNAGTEAVQPGQPGATQATADAVAVDGAGHSESAQALTQPSNFSATPTATVGTQANVKAGPGFTASGIGAELAAWKARQQSAKPVQASETPAAAPATQPVTGGLAAEMAALKARSQATTTVDPAKPAPVGIGRDNTPLSEGGKPFKTKAEADTARKLQPMMRVKKQGKGFVLVEKTAAQIAAQEKAARRNLGSVGAGSGPLSAHAFLASQGGLSKSAMADLGFDRNVRVGSKWLFTNTGMTLEGMTEALQQNGYMEGTEQNPAIEMVRRSANGQPQYTAEGWDQIAQAEATARFEDHLAAQQEAAMADDEFDPFAPENLSGDFEGDDLAVAGYDAKQDPIKLEVNALLDKAEALGIDTDTIKETAYEDTKNEPEQAYFERVRAELTRAINASTGGRSNQEADGNAQSGQWPDAQRGSRADSREGDGREGAQGADSEGLTAYTPEEVTARQDAAAQAEATAKRAEEAAARAEAAAKQASEIAQRSVAAADTFELGGNAEDNLSGQEGLKFSRASENRAARAALARIMEKGVTSPDDLRDLLRVPGYSKWAKSAIAGDVAGATALRNRLAKEYPGTGWQAPKLNDQGIITLYADWSDLTSDSIAELARIADEFDAPIAVRNGAVNNYYESKILRANGFEGYMGAQERMDRPSAVMFSHIRPAGGITATTPLFSKATTAPQTTTSTIRAAISKAYGNLLTRLEGKGLVSLTQTEEEAIAAAAQARADKNGGDVEAIKQALRASVLASQRGTTTPMPENKAPGPQGDAQQGAVQGNAVARSNMPEERDGFTRMYHAGSDPTKGGYWQTVPIGGVFDGFFALTGEWGAYGTGAEYFSDIPSEKILSSHELEYELDYETVKSVLESVYNFYEDDFDTVWEAVIEDKSHKVDDDDLMRIFRQDSVGEASWEAQRVRGLVAKKLGYQAVEMDDENGTSYLIVSGTPITRVLDENEPSTPTSQGVDIRRSAGGNLEGFFDPATGKSFLIADNLTAESAPGTLMHEVGIHMAADGKLEPLFTRAGNLLKLARKNPFIQRVQARMDQAGETSNEEAAAYIVTEYENDRAAAPDSVVKWVKDFIADVRAWLFNKGVLLKAGQLTVADIAAVARANANRMAKGDAKGDVRYSKAPNVYEWADRETAPVGAWVKADYKLSDSQPVYQVREMAIDGLYLPELTENGALQPEKRGYVEGYAERTKAGEKAPAISVIEMENGRMRVVDGHRRVLAAKAAGQTTIRALVSPLVDTAEGRVEATAENIKPSTAAPTDQTQTAEFKRWFGDSKVVDADGKPLAVYHGTAADFTEFKTRKQGSNTGAKDARMGFWFSSDAEHAGNFNASNVANRILPVYLGLKNPLVVDHSTLDASVAHPRGEKYESSLRTDAISKAKKAGHDGVIFKNTFDSYAARSDMSGAYRVDLYVAFRPEQIKSAIGNNGNFDPTNPDIRRSVRNGGQSQLLQQQAATTWDDLGDSRVDELIYEAQDDRIDLKRVQENIAKAGRSIREEFDARTAETLLPGRLASRTETFMDIEVKPLMRDMAANNVTMEALSDYMLARHAPERNAQIAKVNPDMPDGGAGTNSQGVLMTTQAANDHIAALTTGKRMALELLARRVDTITKGTRELLVAEGLEKADTVKAWEGAYKHYVPLFRDESAETPGHPIGSGISVTGTSSKRATGSTKEVTNMLAHVLMQREAAITRAEKNRVAMSLYGMALSHPNKGFWSTVQPNMKTADIVAELQRMGVDPMDGIAGMDAAPTIRTVDERTNLVVDRPNPMYKKLDNAIVVKVNGEDRVILFNTKNARAMRLAESLKNQHMDAGVVADAMNSVATVTRFMASMLTQYNPAFGMVNAVRDVQGALVNLSSTELAGKQARVLADTPAAVIGIARDLRGDPKRTPWSDLWVQFQEDGGRTGYRDLVASPYERTANIEKDLKRMQNEGKLTAGNAAHAVLDVLGDFNDSLENGVRLAAYKAALDKGMSRPQAAKLARELTVDFNRKGRTGRELGKLYAFLNASIQGNARTLATLVGKHGGKVMAGGFALGVLQALMLAAAGFEEDEIPEFVKSRAFIIPMGGKQYVAIPLALGLHVLPNTSRVLTELMMTGGEDWQTRVPTAMAEIVNAANPFGGGGDWTTLHGPLTMVMPTVLDPLLDLGFNRDFTGKPISRTSYNERTPGAAMAREGTLRTPSGQVYLGISEAINSLSGGNARKAGTFSPTPEEVRYVLGVAGGGVFRETEKAINAAVMLVRGDEIKATQVPLGSRFVGEVRDEDVQRTRFYKNSRKLEDLEADLKNARKSQDEAEERRLAKDARTGLIGMNNSVQRRITEINRLAKDEIGDRAALARHDASRADLMRALNDEVRNLEKAAQ